MNLRSHFFHVNNIMKLRRLKRLFINFSFRSIANLLSKIIGLITLPIITRALGPEAYGNFNLVGIIAHYTSLPIGMLGLRNYQKWIQRKFNDPHLNLS